MGVNMMPPSARNIERVAWGKLDLHSMTERVFKTGMGVKIWGV